VAEKGRLPWFERGPRTAGIDSKPAAQDNGRELPVGSGFRSFAGARSNDEVAPIPAIRGTASFGPRAVIR